VLKKLKDREFSKDKKILKKFIWFFKNKQNQLEKKKNFDRLFLEKTIYLFISSQLSAIIIIQNEWSRYFQYGSFFSDFYCGAK